MADMTNKDALARLLEYTSWANHRVLRVAATLSVDDFRRDQGSSHGGVRGTLVHMLWAEWLWLERFKGLSPRERFDEGDYPDVRAVSQRWRLLEEHRTAWFEEVADDAVSRRVTYSNTKGESFTQPLWQLVQHVANHATYHRGQVVTLLRQAGAKPPATDMMMWDREVKAGEVRERERRTDRSGEWLAPLDPAAAAAIAAAEGAQAPAPPADGTEPAERD